MKKSLLALTLVALISSVAVTECINEAEAQTSVTQTVEAEAPVEEAEPVKEEEPVAEDEEELVYAGNYKLTFYCPCELCCGPNAQGITASGTVATEGRTVSADVTKLPLGTRIYIEDMGEYVVEDTGSAIQGNILDVYLNSHEECLQRGFIYKDVYIITD